MYLNGSQMCIFCFQDKELTEKGWWENIKRAVGHLFLCNLNALEDEYHWILGCSRFMGNVNHIYLSITQERLTYI